MVKNTGEFYNFITQIAGGIPLSHTHTNFKSFVLYINNYCVVYFKDFGKKLNGGWGWFVWARERGWVM